MLEPILGLLSCLLLYFGVWVFRKLSSEFHRDVAFERWCASRPMIMAFRTKGDAYDARMEVRALLEPHGELVNVHGGVPWQYYRFDVVVKTHADDVVAVHIESAIVQRGGFTRRRDAAELVRAVVRKPRTEIVEVWMHGQLQPSDARSATRDHHGWLARVVGGELDLHPMIGRPPWAQAEI